MHLPLLSQTPVGLNCVLSEGRKLTHPWLWPSPLLIAVPWLLELCPPALPQPEGDRARWACLPDAAAAWSTAHRSHPENLRFSEGQSDRAWALSIPSSLPICYVVSLERANLA